MTVATSSIWIHREYNIPSCGIVIDNRIIACISIPIEVENVVCRRSHRIDAEKAPGGWIIVPRLHINQPSPRIVHMPRIPRPMLRHPEHLRPIRPVRHLLDHRPLRIGLDHRRPLRIGQVDRHRGLGPRRGRQACTQQPENHQE